MKHNIVLIGFMCTGKTTIGRLISCKANLKFIDTDLEIKKRCGLDISDIFETRGEDYFRRMETLVVSEISSCSNTVISCGGGIIKNELNIEMLKESGIIFCLKSDIDSIYDRIIHSDEIRPLVKGKTKSSIKELMDERDTLYSSFSDYIIYTQNRDVSQIADEILIKYRENLMA